VPSARSSVSAKIKGHTVIGSAGGADKGAFLKQIGVDHVIDYKATGNLTEALLLAGPNGLDVGGEHLEAALTAANPFARFALCGMISQYNVAGIPAGPRNIMFAVGKSIRLEGFIVSNHFNLLPEFQKDISRWTREGKLTWKETIEHGIENTPTAFLKLFKGKNLGKMLVKAKAPPQRLARRNRGGCGGCGCSHRGLDPVGEPYPKGGPFKTG
jgi:NADPH-dependent curcumin reductase CurA